MKKKLIIALISCAAILVVLLAWAIGVAMGQKNGGLNGEYNKVVHNAILLKYINEDRPEAAENWMKGFIKDGVETLDRDENASLLTWFKLYMNNNERPPFSDSLKPTIDDVVTN